MAVPTTSQRCGPPWRKRRGERPFCAKAGAVRKEERAVVKEITRVELKAKMDRGTTSSSWRHSRGHTTRAATCRVQLNLPYEFVDDAEKVLPDKRAEIVIYCIDEECDEASR
jgi:hypothetical protein